MKPEELAAIKARCEKAGKCPIRVAHPTHDHAEFVQHCYTDLPALVAEVERLREDEKNGGRDYLALVDKCDALVMENAHLKEERDEAVKWGEALSSRRFSDRNDHALRSRMEQSEAEVERLRKVEAAARHLIDMIGRTGGVIPVESVENMVAALDAAQGGG